MSRRLFVLRDTPEITREEARRLIAELPAEHTLWAGGTDASLREIRRILGRTVQACVVDCHDGFDADLLGQCHGFVAGDGVLILRCPETPPRYPRLAAWGFDAEDVTLHFHERVEQRLCAIASPPSPVSPSEFVPRGTADQAAAIASLRHAEAAGAAVVLTADRGRGKSAALGMWLAEVQGRVALTAASEDAIREVTRFGPERLSFTALPEVIDGTAAFDVIVVDEAAQIPVSTLRELTQRHPDAVCVFSTTTHGYEGTGRGFTLKFVRWLERERETRHVTLRHPIRWDVDDPLEAAVFDALLLDAEPLQPPEGEVRHRHVPRAELAADDGLLRQVFGLLVQAHYRTTPADLHRLLDAPNLAVHASFVDEVVVAATLVAMEGGLTPDAARELSSGAMRVVGHALPESFAAHLTRPELAELRMIRSVRIAAHPDARRRGLASYLVRHVHASYDVDLFGTVFGAEPEVVLFRRKLGYHAVRLSASRGRRTGVPSVVMVHPVTEPAVTAVAGLRREFARDLPIQLELLRADASLRPEVSDELSNGLDEPAKLTADEAAAMVRAYAHGPRTLESVAYALEQWIGTRLDGMPAPAAELIRARVLDRCSWPETAARSGQPSVPAAMRAMRRTVRSLVDFDPFMV